MTKRQAINKSIKHWERMIEWVKKQDLQGKVCSSEMGWTIKENWNGSYCSLCDRFSENCPLCPLSKKYGKCGEWRWGEKEVKNAWGKVVDSHTWSEWLTHAKVMLKQLRSL